MEETGMQDIMHDNSSMVDAEIDQGQFSNSPVEYVPSILSPKCYPSSVPSIAGSTYSRILASATTGMKFL
jgi:hypothetical protein